MSDKPIKPSQYDKFLEAAARHGIDDAHLFDKIIRAIAGKKKGGKGKPPPSSK